MSDACSKPVKGRVEVVNYCVEHQVHGQEDLQSGWCAALFCCMVLVLCDWSFLILSFHSLKIEYLTTDFSKVIVGNRNGACL